MDPSLPNIVPHRSLQGYDQATHREHASGTGRAARKYPHGMPWWGCPVLADAGVDPRICLSLRQPRGLSGRAGTGVCPYIPERSRAGLPRFIQASTAAGAIRRHGRGGPPLLRAPYSRQPSATGFPPSASCKIRTICSSLWMLSLHPRVLRGFIACDFSHSNCTVFGEQAIGRRDLDER
jgi:hypothetical protein